MKLVKNIVALLLSVTILGWIAPITKASASNLDVGRIKTTITTHNGVTVTETIVPTELEDKWEEDNGWESEEIDEENLEKLSHHNPFNSTPTEDGISLYGASPPLFTYWNVKTQGAKTFSGSFNSTHALYTNHAYKGTTTYRVKARNTGSTKVGFEARDRITLFRSTTLLVGATHYFDVNTNSANNSFYLKFYPINGAGSVSGDIRAK